MGIYERYPTRSALVVILVALLASQRSVLRVGSDSRYRSRDRDRDRCGNRRALFKTRIAWLINVVTPELEAA